jgi:hypothetical protein
VSKKLEPTGDGPRLTIVLAAVKPEVLAPSPPESIQGTVEPLHTEPLRVLGAMRIKNEAAWIRESIESQLPICQKILVLDDHSTDETRNIVRSFGDRCVLFESTFEGVSEGRDKRFLLMELIAENPDWALWIDGDEALEPRAPEILAQEMQRADVSAYCLQMLYFWDSLTQIRVDGVYGRLHRFSLFRIRGEDTGALVFPQGSGEADLHNGGNCPHGTKGLRTQSAARIKHYGYLTREERQRKYEFYNKVDPNNESEDCYRHIIEVPGARHAPGPAQFQDWAD